MPAIRYSWGSMLATARAPVAVLAIGSLALVVPPQTRDMLTILDDGVWPACSFAIALFVLGLSSWYWSRAALAARFAIADTQRKAPAGAMFDWIAFTWLPRATLAATSLTGMTIAISSGSVKTAIAAVGFGIFAVLVSIIRPRSHAPLIGPAPRGTLRSFPRVGWTRFCVLMRRGPGGPVYAIPSLAMGCAILLLGMIEAFGSRTHWPNLAAAAFPGPGTAILLLGLMIGPLTVLCFVCDGLTFSIRIGDLRLGLRRPPMLVALLVYVFILVPNVWHVHTVRLIRPPSLTRMRLDQIFPQWVKACAADAKTVHPVIVAISGGATRAGLWGAAVLDQVLQAQRQTGTKLFAVSSVSGGSLGAAAAMTLLSQTPAYACQPSNLAPLRHPKNGHWPLSGDALGPLLAGWLLDDIPRATFEPIAALMGHGQPNGGDSAEAIERAFEDLWDQDRPAGSASWDQPFLSLFYDRTGQYRAGMPIWLANGTDARTGNRVLTSPIGSPVNEQDPAPWPFLEAQDMIGSVGGDVSIATAINNTARFPYLEPFGEMIRVSDHKPIGSLIDGGYFDNEGLQTAVELANWLAQQHIDGRSIEPIIVEATADGETPAGSARVIRCGSLPASVGPTIGAPGVSAWQILAPLVGLYKVRGGHSIAALLQTRDLLCDHQFFHFFLPSDGVTAVPLNWQLSEHFSQFIWQQASSDSVLNKEELRRLNKELAAPVP